MNFTALYGRSVCVTRIFPLPSVIQMPCRHAEMEHQTVRDTTVGREKPMGQRGAWVADTKGEAQD